MAPLLIRLDQRLRSTSDVVERAELVARLACYLARIGDFEEVRKIIIELRLMFSDGHNARISSWIMLAEGIIEFFEKISPRAKDRIARAQLISMAIGDRSLGALASAWKAHIDFETSDFESMGNSLHTAIDMADADNDDAQSRLSMVIADALYLCGERAKAQYWFMKSRSHALNAGDHATIDALLYNRAAFSVAWLRSESCFDEQDLKIISLVHQEIESSKNFQDLARIGALKNFVGLCDARVLMMKKDFQSAIEKFGEIRHQGPFASYNFSLEMLDLEITYCLNKLNMRTKALECYENIRSADFSKFDVDDRLVVSWIKRELSISDPIFGNISECESSLNLAKADYRIYRTKLVKSIEFIHELPK